MFIQKFIPSHYRNSILVAIASFLTVSIFAQGIQFSEGSWAEIKAKAKTEKKYIFVDAYAVWCGPCKWMAKEVFTDAKAGEVYNAKFVNYKFDMEKGEGIDFAKEYKVQAYPTLVFFNPDGELVHKVVGAQQVDALLEEGKVAQDAKQQLPTLAKKYAAGDKTPEFLYDYTMRLSKAYEDASKVAVAYLNTQKKEDWTNEKNFDVIQRTQGNYKSEVYQYIIKNKADFIAALEEETVNVYIQNGIMAAMRPIIKEKDEKAYTELKSEIIKLTGDQAPKLNAYFDMHFHRETDKGDEYKAIYYDKFCDNSNELNSVALNYFEKEEEPSKLEQALRWVDKSIELNKNWYNLDTKANLLNKLGKTKEALAFAEEAVKIAEEGGEDPADTKKLVEELKAKNPNVNKSPAEEGIAFEEGSWDEIKAKAKAEKKYIFVDAFAVWCGPCKWMANNVFPDAEVGKLYNEKFVNYKFDMEKGEGPAFAKAHNVAAYPTLLFFSPEGELVHKVVGGIAIEQLIEQGNTALDPNKQLFTLKKKYEAGERNPEFLYNYAMALASVYEDANEPASLYLKTQDKEKWSSEENFELILNTQHDYKSEAFLYVTNNKTTFVNVSDKETVDGYIEGVMGMAAEQIIASKDATAYNALKEDVKKLMGDQANAFIAKLDFYYHQGSKDEFKYLSAYLDKYCENSVELNEVAWMYFESETNKQKLKAALRWAEKSVELDRNWANMDTKANLLNKLGNKKEALSVAQNAVELGQALGQDTTETEKLVAEIKASMKK